MTGSTKFKMAPIRKKNVEYHLRSFTVVILGQKIFKTSSCLEVIFGDHLRNAHINVSPQGGGARATHGKLTQPAFPWTGN